MLIEEILPINYYNQLIGILVDTTILKSLIKKFMPQLSNIIENDKEYDGNFIGDAFINKILVNLFINTNIDSNISLLIFDYLFIRGNKVIFLAFLSIYKYLYDFIINGEKSIENYSQIINQNLKDLKSDNENFIYNLFFNYKDDISKITIDEYRNIFSTKISQSLEEKNVEFIKSKIKLAYSEDLFHKQLDNSKKCHKKWPYCLTDSYFENVTRVVELLAFGKKEIKYIDNYFFEKKQDKKSNVLIEFDDNNIKKDDEQEIDYNIILERRPHFCNEVQEEMNLEHKQKEEKKKNELNKIQLEEIKEDEIKEKNIDNIELNIDINEENNNNNNNFEYIKTIIDNECLNVSKMIEEDINEDGKPPENDDE